MLRAQQPVDRTPGGFRPSDRHPPPIDITLAYDLEVGDTYEQFNIANGWRTDTLQPGRHIWDNPYRFESDDSKYKTQNRLRAYYYKNGKRYTGPVCDTIRMWDDALVLEVQCINGMPEGTGRFYDLRMKGVLLREGPFLHGEVVGVWTMYGTSGNTEHTCHYAPGKFYPEKVISPEGLGYREIRYNEKGHKIRQRVFTRDSLKTHERLLLSHTYERIQRGGCMGDVFIYQDTSYYPTGAPSATGKIKQTGDVYTRIGIWYFYDEKGVLLKKKNTEVNASFFVEDSAKLSFNGLSERVDAPCISA